MQKKNIFKALAAAMLMPAMLLTTACSNQDDVANINNEPTVKKGYALPVTVNVTRQGDATTRATYNDNGDRTGSLAFSTGDKLFVSGSATAAYYFAGTLNYVSEGTFSGTIYTQNEYSGTADALFSAANDIYATLLPNGYESYNFLSIIDQGTSEKYDDEAVARPNYAFVASETAKAKGVEQFSFEKASNYSSGFALAPQFAILNFTISGLEAGAKDVTLYVTQTSGPDFTVTGSVTPNASGVATFAIGVPGGFNIKDMSNNLTVGTHNFTLPSSTTFTAGKIYNITRGTGATVNLSTINANYTASNGVTLTGTLASNVQISIADGATVILNGVTINGTKSSSYKWAGITCLGDATIILSGTNTVKGFYEDYPGIYVPVGSTVTINGSGLLTASSNGYGAGIGGVYKIACGNIEIQGGTVEATGGNQAAGIGSGGNGASCGTITISGGTVTATGGSNGAAGIGSGGSNGASCGTITITSGVTKVTATKGSGAPKSIGAGNASTCGTVTIGGTVYPDGVTTSPFTYQP